MCNSQAAETDALAIRHIGYCGFIVILWADGEKISAHSLSQMTQGAIIKGNVNTHTLAGG